MQKKMCIRDRLDAAAGPRNKDKGEKYVETLLTHYRPFWDKGVQVDIVDKMCIRDRADGAHGRRHQWLAFGV